MEKRIIKFRGKSTETGEWVYGSLLLVKERAYIAPIEAIPETVGQFTGLLDQNGKEIFEGDIIEIDGGVEPFPRAKVVYEHAGFRAHVPWVKDGLQPELQAYVGWQHCDCRVIGNVTDNPELLK